MPQHYKTHSKGQKVAVGQTVRFKNGAVAKKQSNGKFKIVKGPHRG